MVKKLTYYKNFNIKKNHKKSIILIGNFDGVHLGHQKLFDSAKKHKKKENLKIDPEIAERAAVLASMKKQIAVAKVNAQRAATIEAQKQIENTQ